MLTRAGHTWLVASKLKSIHVWTDRMLTRSRYHVPHSVRDHIDYITPGITLREVVSVGKASNKIQKRSNGLLPILEPILMPIEEILNNVLQFCDLAVTPQCIKGTTSKPALSL